MIPRTIHFIHFDVGLDLAVPVKSDVGLLESWGYEVRWWDEKNIDGFHLADNIRRIFQRSPIGASDLLRYEILHRHGGLYFDTDFAFHRKLPDWIHECEALCAYESPVDIPGLVGSAFLGGVAGNRFYHHMVNHFIAHPLGENARIATSGPQQLTKQLLASNYLGFTFVPHHFFYPEYKGPRYSGGGPVYAQHLWHGSGKSGTVT